MKEKQKGKIMRLYVQRVIEGFAGVVTYKLYEQRREGQVRHDKTRQKKKQKKKRKETKNIKKGGAEKEKKTTATKKGKKKQQKKTRKEGKLKEQ